MSLTVLDMSMSLDGFITGPNVRPDNGLGDGGPRLHEWVFAGAEDDLQPSGRAASGCEPPGLRRDDGYRGRDSRT